MRLKDVGVRHPVMQAGMPGIARTDLAAAVEQGITKSLSAGRSLSLITEKSTSAVTRVNEIIASVGAHARDAQQVEAVMTEFGKLAKRTSEATSEQKRAGAHVSKDLELIRDLGVETQRATEEQITQSSHIMDTVQRVSDQMVEIVKASSSQVQETEAMSAALDTFSRLATDGEQRAQACRDMIEKLIERAGSLQTSIDRFDS